MRHAHQIIAMDRGRIVERGLNDELLAKGGYLLDALHDNVLPRVAIVGRASARTGSRKPSGSPKACGVNTATNSVRRGRNCRNARPDLTARSRTSPDWLPQRLLPERRRTFRALASDAYVAKNDFVRPASRVSFCFTGAGMT
ncbi:conserved hypothetical protein [Ricinus communis]|uniref:Uncharacterized protein n=1 Tax=Ricinus communis TaxID=3988 RepID=B9TC71_RICCO|nr:conserved hypothetical protein [Ricinus communis]